MLLGVQKGTFAFLGISLEASSEAAHERSARAVEDRLLVRIGGITVAIETLIDRVEALEQRLGILEETVSGEG